MSTASANTAYLANGAGSGDWRKLNTNDIEGLGTQGGQNNLTVMSDGLGGFRYSPLAAYGSLTINNNTTNFPVTAASFSDLNTDSDYKIIAGTGAPWTPDLIYGTGTSGNSISIATGGVYRVDVWMDIVAFPTNTAKLAMKYVLNGNQFSLRKITLKSNSGGDAGSLNGFGLVQLNSGDTLSLALASTHTGNVIFESGNATVSLVRAI